MARTLVKLNTKIIIGLALALVALMFAPGAFAQELFFNPASKNVKMNEVFSLEVLLNTEGKEVNAVALGLFYDKNLLELQDISDGGSIINYWAERPSASSIGVSLQGGAIGGFNGASGKVITVVFRALKDGKAQVAIDKSSAVFLNDGKGTQVFPKLKAASITVGKEVAEAGAPLYVDTDPPEIFDGIVTRVESLFDGKYFLAFSVRDQSSGIDYVEVKEGSGDWVRAESPYLLRNQNLDADIMIKAVDKVGNVKIQAVKLARTRWPEIAGFVAVLLAIAWVVWRKWKKS